MKACSALPSIVVSDGGEIQKYRSKFSVTPLIGTHRSPFGLRFWSGIFPFGLLSLPAHGPPPGPVTRRDSRPFEDFLNVNSTCSPSFKLRKPSITSLLCWDEGKEGDYPLSGRGLLQRHKKEDSPRFCTPGKAGQIGSARVPVCTSGLKQS